MADEIAIVQSGKLVLHGTVAELVAGGKQTLRIKVDTPDRARGDWLRGLGFVTASGAAPGGLDLTLERIDDESSIAITRALVRQESGSPRS